MKRAWLGIGLTVYTLVGCSSSDTTRGSGGPGDGAGDAAGDGADGAEGTDTSAGDGRDSGGSDNVDGNGSDDNGNDGVCQEFAIRNERLPPDMLIVLDRSGSMTDDSVGGVSRWDGSVSALKTVTTQFDDQVRFGLMMFPGDGPSDCSMFTGFQKTLCEFLGPDVFGDSCGEGTMSVDIGAQKAMEISDALDAADPEGATPTASSLRAAHDVLGSVEIDPDQLVAAKYVLLVTDGAPNCETTTGNGSDDPAVTASVDAIEALAADGIKTYVIGYQTAGDAQLSSNLDQMASAGDTGETAHRSVTTGDELFAEFEEIAGKAISCEFALEEAPPDPSYVLVKLDGMQINLGEPDGWSIDDSLKKITVQGSACTTLQGGGDHILSVEVLCEVVAPI